MEPEAKGTGDTEVHYEPTLSDAGENVIGCAAILDNLSDAIITTDMKLVITGWNRVAESIYGWRADDTIGKPLESVVHTEYEETTLDAVLQHLIAHGKWQGAVIQHHQSGKPIDMMASVSLVKDSDNHPIGIINVNRDLTEFRQTEQALQAFERRYQAIFDNSPDGILIADVESKHFIYANPSIGEMLGYTIEELLTLGVADIHPPDQLAHIIAQFEAQARAEIRVAPEIPCLKKDGTIFYADISTAVATLDNTRCNVGFFRDITERQQTRHKLRTLSEAVEQSANCIVITDFEGRIEYVNPKFCEITGYTSAEVLGQNPRILQSGQTPPETYKNLWNTLVAGQAWRGEFLNRKKNGDVWWELASIFPIHNADGTITNFVAVKEDISERKQTENTLRASEEKFRSIFAESPISIEYYDANGRLLDANTACLNIFGVVNPDELKGFNLFEHGVVPPDALERLQKGEAVQFEVLRDFAQVRDLHLYETTKNGQIWLRTTLSPLGWDEQTGTVQGYMAQTEDITDYKRAEEELRENEERYRQVTEMISDYAYMHQMFDDGSLRLTWIVGAFEATTGFTQEESEKRGGWEHLIHQEDMPIALKRIKRLMAGEPDVSEFRIVRADGEIRWLRDHGYPVWDADAGRVVQIYGAVQDITESKNAEQTLMVSEQRYRQLIENLHSGVIVYAPDTSIILHNECAFELLGTENDYLFGKKADELGTQFVRSDGTTLPLREYPIHRVLDSQEPLVNLELGIIRPHTTMLVWVLVNAFPVFNETQEDVYSPWIPEIIDHVIVTLTDITERKQAVDDLQRLKKFHETLIQNLAEGIVVTDTDNRIEHINPAGALMLGQAAEDIIGQRWIDFIPADQHVMIYAANARRKQGRTDRYELTLTHADGTQLNLLVSGSPRFEGERFMGSIATFTDITGLVKTQNAVKESRKLLQSTLNALSAHIAILDETSTVIEVNTAWRRFADENDLNDPTYGVGINYLALCDSVAGPDVEEASVVATGIRNMLGQDGNGFQLEYPCHSPTEQRWFMMRLDSFLVGNDRRIVMAHYSITERKLAEEKERQQRIVADVLADIASTINQTLDVDQILEYIISKVGLVIPHSGANLMFVDIDQAVARIVRYCGCYAEHGLPEPQLGRALTFSQVPNLKFMAEQPQPLAIPDVREYAGWTVIPGNEWIRSYACAPIRVDGKLIGFINLDSDTPDTFTLVQANRLQVLADQVAIAIRNAQLYQELENYSEFLEQAVAERTERLEQSTEHIESILNSSVDAILLVRRNGLIQQANPTFDQWFGNPNGDVFGQPLADLIKPEQADHVIQTLNSVFDSHQPQRIEIVAQREDGTFFDVDMAISPIQRLNGEITTVVCSMRDITERKQAERTLRQTLEREVEVGDMRMRFLSMASHDLRNPLAVIQSSVEMLAKYQDRLSEERKEAKFRQIRTGITHMVELLDDVLTIGRAEAGKLTFAPESVELETFCQSILAEIQASIGINHTFDFALTGKRIVCLMDPKLLRHILYNLLSNAVKYSPTESTVTFELHYNAEQIIFRIQDEGIGIPEADQPRLFEPFHRASNVGVTSGTGLGLAIVKRAAELHGGTVSYEAREGTGSIFIVILPNLQPGETE